MLRHYTLRKEMSISYVINFKIVYVYDLFISNSTNHNGTDSTITRLLVASWDLVFKNGLSLTGRQPFFETILISLADPE